MKVYGFKGTRSTRVEWMLGEIGAAYDFVKVDILSGEHKKPEHVGRHAHGLVPAFEDDGLRIIESAAAVLYLADKFADKGMAPAPASKERARYYQHALYAVSTIDETVIPIYFHTVVLPPPARKAEVIEQKMPTWNTAASFLTRELGEGPFFNGKNLGAIDVIVGYDLVLAQEAGLLKAHPTLDAHATRVAARDAFKKAYKES